MCISGQHESNGPVPFRPGFVRCGGSEGPSMTIDSQSKPEPAHREPHRSSPVVELEPVQTGQGSTPAAPGFCQATSAQPDFGSGAQAENVPLASMSELRHPQPEPRLDISVVTFNSAGHVDRLVDSLTRQTFDMTRARITFVDNRSTDNTVERLSVIRWDNVGLFHSYKVVENATNDGFGTAHNYALRDGSAPFVLILNPNTELYPDCIERLVEAAEKDSSSVGAWEPRQVPYEHPKQYNPVSMNTPWCCGVALLLRRDAFATVEGFDERIFLYCEDVDLSWRIRQAGWTLRYVPSACIRHHTYESADQIKPVQLIHSVLGMLYIRTRFGSLMAILRGYVVYLSILFGRRHFPGQRKNLLIIGTRYARDIWHFMRKRRKFREAYFNGLNFAPIRLGAFHAVTPRADMDRHPVVSVLVRTIGKKAQLERALRTISNQTYQPLETVVVEDGPPTVEDVIDRFRGLNIVYRALGENQGRCIAGNTAMQLASGSYLCFLDEDDELFADHVEQLVACLNNSDARVAYSTAFEVRTEWDDNHEIVREGTWEVVFNRPFTYVELCHRNIMPICCVLFERTLFKEYGGMDPALDNQEDWDLWVRYAAHAGPFVHIEKTTALYRVPMHAQQIDARQEVLKQYYAIAREKHGDLDISLNAGQIGDEFEKLVQEYSDTLGVSASSLLVLRSRALRVRIFRWLVQMVLRPGLKVLDNRISR